MKYLFILFAVTMSSVFAGPVLQMNKAFNALSELIPFIADRDRFMEKTSETEILSKMTELQKAFRSAKHDTLIKGDLFAPSYTMINESIDSSVQSFKAGKKDYSHWRLKEITSHCLDCHTKLPISYTSSFQNGDLTINRTKFTDIYNLGLAQLIVRQYVEAKTSFKEAFNQKIIKKEYSDVLTPIKQLLLIDAKVQKNPDDLSALLKKYSERKDLPRDVTETMKQWLVRVKHWKGQLVLTTGLRDDAHVDKFISDELTPLRKKDFTTGQEIDLLFASGLLSNYLFENPLSKKAPEISFWLGWIEKNLQRENFFGSGQLFLKQCIKRYPKHLVAKDCFKEYKESVEFDFSGSSGTHIPEDVKKELDELSKLLGSSSY